MSLFTFSKLSRAFGIALLVAGAAACSDAQGPGADPEKTESTGSIEQHVDAPFVYSIDHANPQFYLGTGAQAGSEVGSTWQYRGASTSAYVLNTAPLDLPGVGEYLSVNVDMHLSFNGAVANGSAGRCWDRNGADNGSFVLELLSNGSHVIDRRFYNANMSNELVQFNGKVLRGDDARNLQVRISQVTSGTIHYERGTEREGCACPRGHGTCSTLMDKDALAYLTVHDLTIYAAWR
jgi:hypothetical protein